VEWWGSRHRPIAAATLIYEVGDPFRFDRESKIARWWGTRVVAMSSGGKRHRPVLLLGRFSAGWDMGSGSASGRNAYEPSGGSCLLDQLGQHVTWPIERVAAECGRTGLSPGPRIGQGDLAGGESH